jgi:hypothetical protein
VDTLTLPRIREAILWLIAFVFSVTGFPVKEVSTTAAHALEKFILFPFPVQKAAHHTHLHRHLQAQLLPVTMRKIQ